MDEARALRRFADRTWSGKANKYSAPSELCESVVPFNADVPGRYADVQCLGFAVGRLAWSVNGSALALSTLSALGCATGACTRVTTTAIPVRLFAHASAF